MFTKTFVLVLSGFALINAQGSLLRPIFKRVTGQLGDAIITQNNPQNVVYQAILPDSNTTTIRGYIAGTSNTNGTGVQFNINFYGFPDASLGPFLYHIHDQPVPSDGNCTGTLGHLDPFIRGETPPCDASQPEQCQVGDLVGKHGKVTSSPFQANYLELYTATMKGATAFFGNRSVVIHSSNATRLTCANFMLVAGNETSSSSPTSYIPFTGSATTKLFSTGAIMAGLVAFLL